MTVAGRPDWARVARPFTVEMLGPGIPYGNGAVLGVSELFGSSVRHSGSRKSGEIVTVAVKARDGLVRVEVIDRSDPGAFRGHRPIQASSLIAVT